MAQRKYTLPRHTILAKQGARTAASLIDFAVCLAFMVALFFALFRPVFKSKTSYYSKIIEDESLNSGLYIRNEDNKVSRISGKENYTVFLDSLEYFYLHYFTGVDIKEGLKPSEEIKDYDVAWFNENILEIGVKDSDYKYFEYAKTGDVDDPTKIGVKKADVSDDLVSIFIQDKYVIAIQDDLNNTLVMAKAGAQYMTYSALSYVLALFVSGIVCYIVVPWILKNGQTLGKKIYKLALANSDGYTFSSPRLLMRFVPFGVVTLSLLLLIPVNIYLVMSIVAIIFLVSFALAMSSPKKMSLHDFVAQTIVVDSKESTIFDGPEAEEKYIAEEDKEVIQEIVDSSYEGEEPELKYEK